MGSTRPRAGVVVSLLAATAVLLVGCGGGEDDAGPTASAAAGATAETVEIRDYAYEPARITVPKGATVTFTNRDSTPHTATSKEPGLFESGSLGTGKSGEIVLDEAGTFAYYCLFHPFMKGTVVVSAP